MALNENDIIAEIFLMNGSNKNLKVATLKRHKYGSIDEPFKSFQSRVGRKVKEVFNELRCKSEFRMEMPELTVVGRKG